MSRPVHVRITFVCIAALVATPSLTLAAQTNAVERPVHWTVDERLYHGNALLAPRFVCNTHLSGSAQKDDTGGGCHLLTFACDMRIQAACARVAPYRPDFHNLDRAARETSLFDMSTYTALHRTGPPSPLLRAQPERRAPIDPNARLEPKLFGGAPAR